MSRIRFQRKPQEEVSVNLTPLIDVVFLLLIFFMVSTTFTKETHLQINLPEADGEVAEAEINMIELVITAEGEYILNGNKLINKQRQTLYRAVDDLAGDDKTIPFIISADAETTHQAVITAMDVAGKLGFGSLSITTQQPAEQ